MFLHQGVSSRHLSSHPHPFAKVHLCSVGYRDIWGQRWTLNSANNERNCKSVPHCKEYSFFPHNEERLIWYNKKNPKSESSYTSHSFIASVWIYKKRAPGCFHVIVARLGEPTPLQAAFDLIRDDQRPLLTKHTVPCSQDKGKLCLLHNLCVSLMISPKPGSSFLPCMLPDRHTQAYTWQVLQRGTVAGFLKAILMQAFM